MLEGRCHAMNLVKGKARLKSSKDGSVAEESKPYRGDTGTISQNVEHSFLARKAKGA